MVRDLRKERRCTYTITLRFVCTTIVAVEKAVCITHSKCVSVALSIQHEIHMLRFVICGLSGCTIFSTLSHRGEDSKES